MPGLLHAFGSLSDVLAFVDEDSRFHVVEWMSISHSTRQYLICKDAAHSFTPSFLHKHCFTGGETHQCFQRQILAHPQHCHRARIAPLPPKKKKQFLHTFTSLLHKHSQQEEFLSCNSLQYSRYGLITFRIAAWTKWVVVNDKLLS